MPLDLITLKKGVSELNLLVTGAKVNKILQPNAFEVDIVLYKKSAFRLIINAHAKFARVSISNQEKKNPDVAPNFCMLLRKHLTGAEVTCAEIANDDRIVKISFSNVNDFYESVSLELYAEIMGKYSNLFLVKDGRILGSLRSLPQGLDGKRITLVGAPYKFPDKSDKISIFSDSAKDVFNLFDGNGFAKFLTANFYDFAPASAREIECRLNGDFRPQNAYETTISFVKENSPCIIDDGIKPDFYFTNYKSILGEKTNFTSLLSAMESLSRNEEEKSEKSTVKATLSQALNLHVKKLNKRAETLSERISSSLNLEDYKLYGELVTQYCYLIKKGQKSAKLINYTENGEEEVEVLLDDNLTPQQNAQKYFKIYRKKKSTLVNSEAQLKDVNDELTYLSSIAFSLDNAENERDYDDVKAELISLGFIKEQKSKKKKQDKPTLFNEYNINGFTALLGKNNVQNDKLLSVCDRNDLWFHVKNYHSSHLILKLDGKTPSDSVLNACAEICAYYSQAKNGTKIEVDYTYRKFVKKQGGKALGAVYYTDYQTLVVNPNNHNEYKK